MLVQNNNRVNQQAGRRDSSSNKQQANPRDSSQINIKTEPLQMKNANLLKSDRIAQPVKVVASTMTGINNSRKARKAAAATLASSKENEGQGLSTIEKMLKVIKTENYHRPSHSGVQDPPTTSISLRSRQSNSNKGNFASKHFTPGKKIQFKPERATITIKQPSVFKMWSQTCPCNPTAEFTRLVEGPRGHFNCIQCGIMAIQNTAPSLSATPEGMKSEAKPIFGLKPQNQRQQCDIAPQKTIAQLRKSSEAQRAGLQSLVPTDGNFDQRIIQIRATMLQLIIEISECLHQSSLTLHLTIEYMDRYLLIRNNVSSTKPNQERSDSGFISSIFEDHSLDDVSIACLLLASKFDEIDDNIPMIEEFCKAHTLVRDSLDAGFLESRGQHSQLSSGRTYPGFKAIERCELYLLNALSWDLNTVTPMHFVQQHLYHGIIFTSDQTKSNSEIDENLLLKVHRHVEFFASEALKQKFMLTKEFSEQVIAASIVYAARFASKVIAEPWLNDVFPHVFGLDSLSKISGCFEQLYAAYDTSTNSTEAQSQDQHQQRQLSPTTNGGSQSEARKHYKIEIKLALVDNENLEIKENQTERDSSSAFRNSTSDNNSQEEEVIAQSLKLSTTRSGLDGAGHCSTNGNEENNGSNGSNERIEDGFSQVVAHSTKNSISMDASTDEVATTIQPKQPSESKNTAAQKSNQKSANGRQKSQQSNFRGLMKTIPITKSKSRTRPGQQPQSVINHARKTSFDQHSAQATLKVLNKPSLQLSRAADCFGQADGVSLSPVKELRNSNSRDTGPIKVFKSRQARHTMLEPSCRDRSSSSTSLFRLQPTNLTTTSNLKRFACESTTSKSGMLIGLPGPSTESQQKRFGNKIRSSRQNSITPRVHNFLHLSRQQSEAQNRNQIEHIDTDQDKERESSRGPLNRLLQKQKQAVAREDPDNRRFQISKSIVSGIRKSEDLSVPRSEMPEDGTQEVKPQQTERSTLKGSNVRSQAKSALSQVKVYLQGEAAQANQTRINRENQNFIRKNINYVTQLDQNVKERRSLQTCYSFIDLEPKTKLSQMQKNGKQDQAEIACTETRLSLKAMPLKPFIAGGKRSTPLGHSSQYQTMTVGGSETLQLQRASSKSVMEGRTPKLAGQQAEIDPSLAIYTQGSNITPKQVSSYRASKLFSKKPMVATNSSVNVSTNANLISSPAIFDKEQTNRPNKSTAIHKFKASAQIRQFSKGISSSHLQNYQPTRNTQLTLTSINDDTVMTANGASTLETSATPHEGSNAAANFSTLTVSKQRSSNNHLRPTKSSMLRAKSSLGLSQPPQYNEADMTNIHTLGKINDTSAKSTLMQEMLIQVSTVNTTTQNWQVGTGSKSRSSSNVVSPKFGPPIIRKSRAAGLTLQELEVQPPFASCNVDKDAAKQQPTTPMDTSGKKVKLGADEHHNRPRATNKLGQHQHPNALSRKSAGGAVSKRPQSGQRTFSSRFSLKPSQKQGREKSPQQQPTTSSKTTENSKIQNKGLAFRGSFQLR